MRSWQPAGLTIRKQKICCTAYATERVLDRILELLECLAAAARERKPNALHHQ